MKFFRVSENGITHHVRAKYYHDPSGGLVLASLQAFNQPRFKESGWEASETEFYENSVDGIFTAEETQEFSQDGNDTDQDGNPVNVERATRRARKNAFDMIMCNPDLDTFATFTYSPDAVDNKQSYQECYRYLSKWLDNRVQRNGLKYVCVPERTKAGDIHFHGIMNSNALKLVPAVSPYTGRPLTHHGKPLFNISDWRRGFTSAEPITKLNASDDERAAVSKYIFKYMGKQAGQKIGGRYCLIGGVLKKPIYVYGETPDEFLTIDERSAAVYKNHRELSSGLVYDEWSFT